MSIKKLLGRLLLFGVLEMGALAGSMTPEQIEQLMNLMHRVEVVQVVKKERDVEPR